MITPFFWQKPGLIIFNIFIYLINPPVCNQFSVSTTTSSLAQMQSSPYWGLPFHINTLSLLRLWHPGPRMSFSFCLEPDRSHLVTTPHGHSSYPGWVLKPYTLPLSHVEILLTLLCDLCPQAWSFVIMMNEKIFSFCEVEESCFHLLLLLGDLI